MPDSGQSKTRVGVIGSFRRDFSEVRNAIEQFEDAGFIVTSPLGKNIIQTGVQFVRFRSDEKTLSDAEVQSVTLERLFESDVVYVVAPDGYVGRTTCYEIGRLFQAKHPIYFSELPQDLPIELPPNQIISIEDFIEVICENAVWMWPYLSGDSKCSRIERRISNESQSKSG